MCASYYICQCGTLRIHSEGFVENRELGSTKSSDGIRGYLNFLEFLSRYRDIDPQLVSGQAHYMS